VKPVYGLTTGQRRKALLRGELPLSIDSALKCVGLQKKYVEKGTIAIYMTLGFVGEDGAIGRDPAYPNTPHVLEIYKAMYGKELTGPRLNVFKHFVNMSAMSNKILWLPKGTPKNIRDMYAETAKKIYADKKFQKMTKKSFGDYPQVYGARALRIIKDAVDFSPESKAWMLEWIETKMKKST
jgi:hypothetical protein